MNKAGRVIAVAMLAVGLAAPLSACNVGVADDIGRAGSGAAREWTGLEKAGGGTVITGGAGAAAGCGASERC